MTQKLVQIRPARLEDIEFIHHSMGGLSIPVEQLKWLIRDQGQAPSLFVNVHTMDDKVSGFIAWRLHDQMIEILDLGALVSLNEAAPIIHSLMDYAFEWSKNQKIQALSIKTHQDNKILLELLKELNFSELQELPHFYGRGHHGVLLFKKIF